MSEHNGVSQVKDGTPLKLSDIEKGLSKLWAKAAGMGPGTEGPAEIRVCTLSLVVYVPDESQMDAAFEAVRATTQEHPLRAVYMRLDPERPTSSPEGEVSGYCQITPAGNVQICCEQVVVRATGGTEEQLASSVANLLVPDLPVVLWWMGEPAFEMPLLQRLESVSDYLVVDSKEFSGVSTIREMVTNIEKNPLVTPNDLNWIRMTDWREGTAELFNKSEFLPCLDKLSNVEIRYAKEDAAQAILFAGWLSSRLKWAGEGVRGTEEDGKLQLAARNPLGEEVLIALLPENTDEFSPGSLYSIRLYTSSETHAFELTFTEGAIKGQVLHDEQVLELYCHGLKSESCDIPQLLSQELSNLWPDPIYREALMACGSLLSQANATDGKNL